MRAKKSARKAKRGNASSSSSSDSDSDVEHQGGDKRKDRDSDSDQGPSGYPPGSQAGLPSAPAPAMFAR